MTRRFPVHWAWIILGTCFVNLFINYSVRLGYGVVLPEMIRNLGFGRADAGSIFNAYLLTYVAVTPVAGMLTDRFGARGVITVCTMILGMGALLMGTVTNLWTGCLFYALVGLGASGIWTPVITVVQRWFAVHRRGLALGVLSTGYGLGFATMGAVFPWIVHRYTWRHAWYFLGAAALLVVVVNGLLLRSSPESAGCMPWGHRASDPPPMGDPRETLPLSTIFRKSTFWLIGLSYFSISYTLYGITTFMIDFAESQLKVPLEKASLLATIHGAGQIVGVLSVLPLSDYIGRKKTVLISNSVITAAMVGILLKGGSWHLLTVFIGTLAVFYGATFPVYGACAGDYFPRKVMGTVIGAWTPFYGLGAILTHWVTGYLRDATGSYGHAFLIHAAMAALSILFMGAVKIDGDGLTARR